MDRFRAGALLLAAWLGCGAVALGKPVIALHLTGVLIAKQADGRTVQIPVAKAVLKKNDLVRYTIAAVNRGTSAALRLVTVGPVPKGTSYVGGSASPAPQTVLEYSLDGKTWSVRPTVAVKTPQGLVRRPAPASAYVAVRWRTSRALAPKAVFHYFYEVRVR